MEWFNALLDGELTIPEMAGLFVALLVVLFIVFWLFRKIFGSSSGRLSKNRQPRLSVTDAAVVDDKRRLVLVRRDNVEHLVMIGGPSDIVVEQNIVRAAPVEMPTASVAPSPVPAPEPAPAPATIAPATPPAPVETRQSQADDSIFSSTANKAGATALAAGAGVAAVGESAASSLTGLAKDASASVTQTASSAVESVSDTVSSVSGSVGDTVTSGVETASEAAGHISNALAADLDDALATDKEPVFDTASQSAAPEVGSADGNHDASETKTEDEMQRLLDELSTAKN